MKSFIFFRISLVILIPGIETRVLFINGINGVQVNQQKVEPAGSC